MQYERFFCGWIGKPPHTTTQELITFNYNVLLWKVYR
jgi:hypothetical protein